jgi:AcrR family transcriptional regulator
MKTTRVRAIAKTPNRGKRAENKEKTRRAILQAALDLFAQKGFYQTTTKAISRKARIAEGTLFNYFETKEDLALYFVDHQAAESTLTPLAVDIWGSIRNWPRDFFGDSFGEAAAIGEAAARRRQAAT